MDAQSFLAALASALTDAAARERLLAEPRAALADAGLDLPVWFAVTAVEGDAPGLTLTVPPALDPEAELSEEQLVAVSGGCLTQCTCWKEGETQAEFEARFLNQTGQPLPAWVKVPS